MSNIIKVELLAFDTKERMREVNLPKDIKEYVSQDDLLDQVFHLGQNDFQPLEMPSVSVGDIIHLENKKIMVMSIGFLEIDDEDYTSYKATPRRDRVLKRFKCS